MDLLKNLDDMITAEEFYKQTTGCVINHIDIKNAMIEFAKLHVTKALKEASEKAEIEDLSYDDRIVNVKSILNAYSLENIK